MQEISTKRVKGNMIFKGHKLTLGLDLGDHWFVGLWVFMAMLRRHHE